MSLMSRARWTARVMARATLESVAESQQAHDARALGQAPVNSSGHHPPASHVAKAGWPIYRTYVGLPDGTELVSDRQTSVGRIRVVRLPPWVAEVNKKQLTIGCARFAGDGIGVDQVIVHRDPNNARLVSIETVLRSYFKGTRMPMPAKSGQRIPLGWDIRGDIRWLKVDGNRALHTLVAGMTGSGKTNTMKHLIGWFAELHWDIWLGDPTGGSEFAEFEDYASNVAWSAEDCATLLQMAADEIEKRYVIMGRERTNFWQGDPLVIFIDELPAVLDKTLVIGEDEKGKPLRQGVGAVSAMKKIVQRGRRARVTLVVGIQSPRAEDMSGGARGQFAYTICHRVQRSIESVVCLGEGSIEDGLNAKNLPGDGRAFMMGLGLDTEQVQVFEARPATAIKASKVPESRRRVVAASVAVGYGLEQGGSTGSPGMEPVGTSAPNRNASPVMAARNAQQRLAKASKSKWATPILITLSESATTMGPNAIAVCIDAGNYVDQPANRSSVLRVLETLLKAGLVYREGQSDWGLTDLGQDLAVMSSTADFYGDEDDDDY